jgi:hypothetical protein
MRCVGHPLPPNLLFVFGVDSVASTNKIALHDIIEILLNVALTTISHKPEVEHTNYVDRSSRISRTMLVFIISWRSILLVEETGIP